jgi:hypothetical protein
MPYKDRTRIALFPLTTQLARINKAAEVAGKSPARWLLDLVDVLLTEPAETYGGRHPVKVMLPPQIIEKLDLVCSRAPLTRSMLIEQLIERVLDVPPAPAPAPSAYEDVEPVNYMDVLLLAPQRTQPKDHHG